jgi:hypothetical protein
MITDKFHQRSVDKYNHSCNIIISHGSSTNILYDLFKVFFSPFIIHYYINIANKLIYINFFNLILFKLLIYCWIYYVSKSLVFINYFIWILIFVCACHWILVSVIHSLDISICMCLSLNTNIYMSRYSFCMSSY